MYFKINKRKINRVTKYLSMLNFKLKNFELIDSIKIAKFKYFSRFNFMQKILINRIMKKKNLYNEITEVVFGFGDNQFPIKKLISIMEKSVVRYVLKIVSLISYISYWRSSKRPSINDLFFLLRTKHSKLMRIRYLLNMKFLIENIMGSSKTKNFTSKIML